MQPKKIIIIGASSGIGKEMALLLAQQGHMVAITGRRLPLLQAVQSQFPQHMVISSFDVTSADSQQQLQQLIERLGGLDIFIYNAGYGDPSETLNLETERLTTATNVDGFVVLVSYAFSYFVQQGYGQIAATSSIAALRGHSWAPAYSASKAFMSIYAEGLNIKAQKLKKRIVVTDIRPGFIDTKKAKGNHRFWLVPPQKAARQILQAIAQKKRVAYISKRWWLIAQLLKLLPYALYKRLA